MPATERLRRAVTAPALLALLLWSGAYALGAPRFTFDLYRMPLGETLGHRLAGKLAACRAAGPACVLILGASSAREGFDEGAVEREWPGTRVFNAGLAAGSVDTLGVSELFLRRSGARPAAIVVGLHPFLLRRMDQDVVARGYSDFFDRFDGRALLRYQAPGPGLDAARRELDLNTLFPPHRHARLLGRHVRRALFALHQAFYWGPARARDAFELARGDTRPMDEYRFDGSGEGVATMTARWQQQGFFDASTYADPRAAGDLDALLESFAQHAPTLWLVLMPEHSSLRARRDAFAPERFDAVVAKARARGARVLDATTLAPDADFLDLAHLGAAGRAALSHRLAQALAQGRS